MGSPYQADVLARVSVIRTFSGLKRAASALKQFASEPRAIEEILAILNEFTEQAYYVNIPDEVLQDNIQGYLRDCEFYDNLVPFVVQLYATYWSAFNKRSRLVVSLTARYEWKGFERFNSAFVFDLTKK